MGCNCKKIAELQKKEGDIKENGLFSNILPKLRNFMFRLMALPFMFLLVPIIIIVLSYQMLFGKAMGIRLPQNMIRKLSKS